VTSPQHARRTQQAPGEALRALLDRARDQDEEAAGRDLLERAVGALVPDEALVLDRLASLGRVPLVHIWTRPHTGGTGEQVLENASRIGRLAGVALPDLTPTYVGRLLALGLVRTEGVDDPDDLGDYFQALLADPLVLRALARANADGTTPRVVRQALRLTPLGARLVAEAASRDLVEVALEDQVESSTDEP
jgi:hypothetical protein